MDFTLPPEIEDIRLRTREFVEQHVMPLEADPANYDDHENIRLDILRELQAKARAAGLWSPQAPKDYGGMALPIVGWAAMYEEANRSIFGPMAFNCQAPDDGNMNLLALTGTKAQKDKWLKPIVDGNVRSSFVMTEPAPGSGSDPGMMRTRAGTPGRQVGHPRPQVVHHRRRRGRSFHPHRAHLGRRPARAHGVSLPPRPARLAHPAPHPDHGTGRARRPLRAAVRRARSVGRQRADERRRRACARRRSGSVRRG